MMKDIKEAMMQVVIPSIICTILTMIIIVAIVGVGAWIVEALK